MNIPFNLSKAMAAASVLLSDTENNCMEYIRLLKLLYIADRETLAESDAPLLGDRVVALKNGPLHSRVFDLIKGEDALAGTWQKFFTTHTYSIRLDTPPDLSPLSRFEIRKLKEVSDRYRNWGTWALIVLTHEFPEWKAAYPDARENTSRKIEFSQIVDAIERTDDLEHLQSLISDAVQFDSL